jgi:hypothetical protein
MACEISSMKGSFRASTGIPWTRTQTEESEATISGFTHEGLMDTLMLWSRRIVVSLHDTARRSSAYGKTTANSDGETSRTFHAQSHSSWASSERMISAVISKAKGGS